MGWLETDNRAILVPLDLTGTATGTELGKNSEVRSTDKKFENPIKS